MADIASYLSQIMAAIYGEEVRGSIHDAIEAINGDVVSALNFASDGKDSAQASAAEAKKYMETVAASAAAAKADAERALAMASQVQTFTEEMAIILEKALMAIYYVREIYDALKDFTDEDTIQDNTGDDVLDSDSSPVGGFYTGFAAFFHVVMTLREQVRQNTSDIQTLKEGT